MRIPVEWLINAYQANLFVAAFNICKNAEDAKDVVQDTFWKSCHMMIVTMETMEQSNV